VNDARGLQSLLGQLESEWRRLDSPIAQQLRSGLPPKQTLRALQDLNLAPCPDIVTWFGWHDGQDLSSGAAYDVEAESLYILTLDRAVDETRLRRSLSQAESHPPSLVLWPDSWLALMTDGAGGAVGVDCSSSPSCPVYVLDRDDVAISRLTGAKVPTFPSLSRIVEQWLGVLRGGR
jgi:cell wall assembly regulator SMI1